MHDDGQITMVVSVSFFSSQTKYTRGRPYARNGPQHAGNTGEAHNHMKAGGAAEHQASRPRPGARAVDPSPFGRRRTPRRS